ncbi:MAG: metal-responsive CopG/Arc/MetJ family transcriptional regulator [Flavobacteriales bacterium]|jgi:metal-responsive CopG/Arc/MetJ family transcriptional regulator
MTEKSANFRVRLGPDLHEQFLATCKRQDIPASQVIRQLIRSYIETEQHQSHSEATLKPL